MNQPILEAKDISKFFLEKPLSFRGRRNKKKVLNEVSFNIHKGDCIALIGRNGSGKSTLLKIISGLLTLDEGHLRTNLQKANISIVSSNDNSFFPRLSIKNNLEFFSSFTGEKKNKRVKNNEILSILKFLKMSDKEENLFMTLSSGEKKKIAFARALLRGSKFMLFDEVTANLDIISKREILSLIKSLIYEKKIEATILATHSLDEVLSTSNRFLMIDNGSIKKEGKIDMNTNLKDLEDLFTNEVS